MRPCDRGLEPPGEPALLATPGGVDLADGVVGQAADRVAIDIGNIGFIPVSVRSLTIGGANPDDFTIVSEACTGGRALNPDASCAVEIEFLPLGSGYRSALLIATANNGAYTTAVLGGFGDYEPSFLRDEASPAQQGGTIGLGGSGFPANVTVAIGFEGGGVPFATVDTNESGTFLTRVTLPARIRVGPRTLTASASGGVAAQLDIVIEGRRRADTTLLPGFGLG